MRILFVDEDVGAANALRESIEGVASWDMDLAGSSVDALEALHRQDYAVIVAGVRDSVALVKKTKELRPTVARIVRSNDADVSANLRALFAAHQVIARDANEMDLVATISQAADLQMLLSNEELRTIVGGVDKLPARPVIYSQLVEILAKPDAGFRDVGQLVQSDVSIATEIIRVVNTPFFSRGSVVTNIVDAVSRLGTRTVRDLVLAMEVFASASSKSAAAAVESIQRHSVDVGVAARSIVTSAAQRDDAFLAGLLHDVGRLVLVQTLPFAATVANDEDLHRERELMGVTHAEIGAYLIGLWGLPYSVMWSAASHHEPAVLGEESLDVAGAVYVAEQVVQGTEEAEEAMPAFGMWTTTAREALGMKQAS